MAKCRWELDVFKAARVSTSADNLVGTSSPEDLNIFPFHQLGRHDQPLRGDAEEPARRNPRKIDVFAADFLGGLRVNSSGMVRCRRSCGWCSLRRL